MFHRNVIAALAALMVLTIGAAAWASERADGRLGTSAVRLEAISEPTARSSESKLGSVAADAVRCALSADVAIVNGGDMRADIHRGGITQSVIEAVFPEDRALAVTVVTPAELRMMLEAGVAAIVLQEDETIDHRASDEYGGFPQVSGLRYKYDASAPPGRRVMEMVLDGGEELSPEDGETYLRLAGTAYMLSGGYDYPSAAFEPSGETLRSALTEYVLSHGELADPGQGRIRAAGARETTILTYVPRALLVIAVVIIALLNGDRFKKPFKFQRFER